MGDLLDRGDQELPLLYWLERLQGQAAAAGGALHVLNGNHESMNVAGQYRYATRGGMHRWARGARQARVWQGSQHRCLVPRLLDTHPLTPRPLAALCYPPAASKTGCTGAQWRRHSRPSAAARRRPRACAACCTCTRTRTTRTPSGPRPRHAPRHWSRAAR